jgi:hypothetical protein
MNVYKEKDESREDFGKYKLYARSTAREVHVMKTATSMLLRPRDDTRPIVERISASA